MFSMRVVGIAGLTCISVWRLSVSFSYDLFWMPPSCASECRPFPEQSSCSVRLSDAAPVPSRSERCCNAFRRSYGIILPASRASALLCHGISRDSALTPRGFGKMAPRTPVSVRHRWAQCSGDGGECASSAWIICGQVRARHGTRPRWC